MERTKKEIDEELVHKSPLLGGEKSAEERSYKPTNSQQTRAVAFFVSQSHDRFHADCGDMRPQRANPFTRVEPTRQKELFEANIVFRRALRVAAKWVSVFVVYSEKAINGFAK